MQSSVHIAAGLQLFGRLSRWVCLANPGVFRAARLRHVIFTSSALKNSKNSTQPTGMDNSQVTWTTTVARRSIVGPLTAEHRLISGPWPKKGRLRIIHQDYCACPVSFCLSFYSLSFFFVGNHHCWYDTLCSASTLLCSELISSFSRFHIGGG